MYVDCPVKPCYLCKKLGHTAATCPFRLDPTLDVAAAPGTAPTNVCGNLNLRETAMQPPRYGLLRPAASCARGAYMQLSVAAQCEACVHKQDQSSLHIHPVFILHSSEHLSDVARAGCATCHAAPSSGGYAARASSCTRGALQRLHSRQAPSTSSAALTRRGSLASGILKRCRDLC